MQHTAGAWGSPYSMSRVAGTRGTLWSENETVRFADSNGVRELPVPDDLVLPQLEPVDDPREEFARFELAPYIRLCEVLRDCVDGRPPESAVLPPTFHDGLACTRVLDAIRQSAAGGGALVELSD